MCKTEYLVVELGHAVVVLRKIIDFPCFVHISQMVECIDMKFSEHLTIILMHLPIKIFSPMDA